MGRKNARRRDRHMRPSIVITLGLLMLGILIAGVIQFRILI